MICASLLDSTVTRTHEDEHGPPRGAIERLLYVVGYGLAHALFLGARSPASVVTRLRLAYRLVGVKIVETPHVDGVERTIFLCPYRDIESDRFGETWLCHRKLDRVDDGYVTFLRRHRDIDYRRPRRCTHLDYCDESEYCYSEVAST